MKKPILASFLLSIAIVSCGINIDDQKKHSQKAQLINFIDVLSDLCVDLNGGYDAKRKQLFEDKVQLFIDQQGDFNQAFTLKELCELSAAPSRYGFAELYAHEGDASYTLLSFFSWHPTYVAAFLKHGAKPVVGEISALDGWFKSYERFIRTKDDMHQVEYKRFFNGGLNALDILLEASDKKDQTAFIKNRFVAIEKLYQLSMMDAECVSIVDPYTL